MATITTRLDEKLKNDAQAVFDKLGLSMSAGIAVYLKQVVKENGIPFELNNNPSPQFMAREELAHYIADIRKNPENHLTKPMNREESWHFLESMLNDE